MLSRFQLLVVYYFKAGLGFGVEKGFDFLWDHV